MSTRLQCKIEVPTAQEDAVITSAARNDSDNPPLTDLELVQFKRQAGQLPGSGTQVSTMVQLDAEVLAAFHAFGKGWQIRMNDALRDWLQSHSHA